jgi:ATPase subunit of ABC transporter with duplicated ATPase domains
MPAVHFDDVSFRYTSAVEVFSGLTMHLGPGWAGVVGANGSGKSTLLSLLAGSLEPTRGKVTLDPNGAIVIRCHQEVEVPSPDIASLARSHDGTARKWMGRLDLDPAGLDRWPTLSPGERKRWQLGSALAKEPDILLLDEPTNHLDAAARATVSKALARFTGLGIVISHDRSFLDALTIRTLRVIGGDVEVWSGPYSTARHSWMAEEKRLAGQYEKAKRTERAVRRRLADERREAEMRSARFKRGMREANPSDHDATSLSAKARHAGGEAAGSRRRSTTRAELDRAMEAREGLARPGSPIGDIFFDYEPAPKARLLQFNGPLVAGDHLLAADIDIVIERGDRIRLTGPNGAGKSTLLDALRGSSPLPEDKLLHLPQELTYGESIDLLHRLDRLTNERRGRVLSVVATLGVDPDRLLRSRRPSPGEARKLALALGLGNNSWCLLLDEPTNHLDVGAVESVETALAEYPGAVVIVTHDDAFAVASTTTVWYLADRKLSVADDNKNDGALPKGST